MNNALRLVSAVIPACAMHNHTCGHAQLKTKYNAHLKHHCFLMDSSLGTLSFFPHCIKHS